jgi:hypothetical protein
MIFQEAIRNGNAKANPARLVRLHREDNSRVRFITYAEEAIIRKIIRQRCPIHEPEFTLALETGMLRTCIELVAESSTFLNEFDQNLN